MKDLRRKGTRELAKSGDKEREGRKRKEGEKGKIP